MGCSYTNYDKFDEVPAQDLNSPRSVLVTLARKRGINPVALFGKDFVNGQSAFIKIKSPYQFYKIIFLEWLR